MPLKINLYLAKTEILFLKILIGLTYCTLANFYKHYRNICIFDFDFLLKMEVQF